MRLATRLTFVVCVLLIVSGCGSPDPDCSEGESLVPVGEPGAAEAAEVCAPARCGTEAWPTTGGSNVIYAAPWGGTTGPGTREAPFGLIQRAIAAAGADGTVLVADGEYVWDLLATPEEGDGVTIQGRCAELVTISPQDSEAPSLWVQGATLEVSGVTLKGGRGLQVMRSADGAQDGALSLHDAVVQDAMQVGVEGLSNSTLELTDVTIRGTHVLEGGTSAKAVHVNTGSHATLTRVELIENMASGIEARGLGTELELEDVTIRNGVSRVLSEDEHDDEARWHAQVTSGFMILVENGASLTARRVDLLDNPGHGIVLLGESGPHDLEDITIRGVRDAYPPPLDYGRSGGTGLIMQAPFSGEMPVTIRNLDIEDCAWVGMIIAGEYLTADLQSVRVRDVRPSVHNGAGGLGMVAHHGSPVTIRDMEVQDVAFAGILVTSEADVTLEDVDVTGVGASVDPGGGVGVAAATDGFVHATGLRISDTAGAGLMAMPGSLFEGSDVQVTASRMAGAVVLGGELALSDSTLSGATPSPAYGGGVGLFAYGFLQDSRVALSNVSFSDTIGPGVYLRGPGSYEIVGSSFDDAGDIRGVPGGIFAAEGVQAWVPGVDEAPGTGLLIEGNTFAGMGLDAILLDDSGATLTGNTFQDINGEPLFVQRCGDEPPPVEVDEQTGVDASCQPEPRTIESLLLYSTYINDALTE